MKHNLSRRFHENKVGSSLRGEPMKGFSLYEFA